MQLHMDQQVQAAEAQARAVSSSSTMSSTDMDAYTSSQLLVSVATWVAFSILRRTCYRDIRRHSTTTDPGRTVPCGWMSMQGVYDAPSASRVSVPHRASSFDSIMVTVTTRKTAQPHSCPQSLSCEGRGARGRSEGGCHGMSCHALRAFQSSCPLTRRHGNLRLAPRRM